MLWFEAQHKREKATGRRELSMIIYSVSRFGKQMASLRLKRFPAEVNLLSVSGVWVLCEGESDIPERLMALDFRVRFPLRRYISNSILYIRGERLG